MDPDELAAAMRRTPPACEEGLPTAADLLAFDRGSYPSTPEASAPASPTETFAKPLLLPPAITLTSPAIARSPSPDISGSRLARRWLAGIQAREGDETFTPSLLDLTQLCGTMPEEASPKSIDSTFAEECPTAL